VQLAYKNKYSFEGSIGGTWQRPIASSTPLEVTKVYEIEDWDENPDDEDYDY